MSLRRQKEANKIKEFCTNKKLAVSVLYLKLHTFNHITVNKQKKAVHLIDKDLLHSGKAQVVVLAIRIPNSCVPSDFR